MKQLLTHKPIIVILAVYIAYSLVLIEVYPPPRTDEMLFAPAAKSFVDEGRLVTPAFFGMEETTMWQPPFYFVLLGFFFKVAGYSFISLRVFSILFGASSLLLVYLVLRKLEFSTRWIYLCLLLIALDPFFLRFTKVGRMDSLCLFFIVGAFYAHTMWLTTSSSRWRLVAVISGVLASLTHPLGLSAPTVLFVHCFILYRQGTCSLRAALTPILLAVFSLLIVVIFYWLQSPSEFITQLGFQFGRKTSRSVVESFFNWLQRYRALPFVVVLVFLSLAKAILTSLRQEKGASESALAIFIVVTFVVVIVSYELFYPIYYVPFVAMLAVSTLRDMNSNNLVAWKKRLATLIVTLAVLNSILFNGYFTYLYFVKLKKETSISSFSSAIGTLIPLGSKVLLIGDPCLYWEYYDRRKDLRLYAGAIDSLSLKKLSQTVDIIVVARGFQSVYDEFIEGEIRYWEGLFSKVGRRFDRITNVGKEIPYAYRGSVYKVVPY